MTPRDESPHVAAHTAAVSCLLLGEEPLVVRCAEVLRERGHNIVGIVSAAPGIVRWASANAVRIVERARYPELLEREPVDVLLSITHPAIIAPENIAKARVAALNYHDGPLPRYAGMNGSTWALMHGERRHGIVWHHLTAGLDEGDILEQREVVLDGRETSVSLNMGNSALALESFRALVARIERRELAGTPQRRDVERTIFSRHDRPGALCVIDWRQSASEIDRLIRACDFGQYTNRFGAAKVVRGGRALIVREAVPERPLTTSPAGTVLAIDDESLLVACGEGALRLKRFTTLTGEVLTAPQAAAALAITPRDSLAAAPPTTAPATAPTTAPAADAAAWRLLAEAEPAWVSALVRRTLVSLPFESTKRAEPAALDLALPDAFTAQFAEQLNDATAALFAFTVSCLVREDRFDVAWVDGQARAGLAKAKALLFPSVPLRFDIDATAGFGTLVAQHGRERARAAQRPAFLTDLVARHPSLREQADLRALALSPIAIVVTGAADGAADDAPPGAHLTLLVQGARCALRSDGHVAPAMLATIARQMSAVASKVAAAPSLPLARVDVLDDGERQRQLVDWNATQRAFPDTLRIHELFEAQVAQRPDAVALVFAGATMSFAELEGRANRVANALQQRGVKPGDYVAVLVERGFDLVAVLIGIAKSGAAYLPIDPSYPEDRARFMLADAGCRVIVASPELAAICAAPEEALLLVNSPELHAAATTRPPCPSLARDVCYTIYTSGSTGRPKGVILTHRAVVNTLDWVNRTFGVGPGDRLLFVTSPSFDLSVYDVFGALGAGASIDIASPALLREPAELARHVVEAGITIWDSAPPALARLATFFPERAPASALRLVMLSGDWIPVWLPDAMSKVFPDVKVKSLGGATEAAIWSNYYPVETVDPSWTSIPYGSPIQNARYYILDSHLRPLPAGIPGDLYIAGTCLAEGYLNRQELTDERFIADPFHANQHMYKTGDLARFWSDGTMEFLGRADFQVKIRGFRVEMGEVEAAIRALPDVRDAVCATFVDGADQKSLIAYVVPVGDAALDLRGIKEKLAAQLPEFMVPSHVIALRALPLSSNGKLDRKALPSPSEAESATAYRAPSTSVERALAEIWQDVLKRKSIGVRDNFFDIGGHSLLAVMLMAELKSRMQIEVPLSRIIESPTIEQLADALKDATSAKASGKALVELKGGGPNNFFLVHDGDGETLLYRTLAQRMPPQFAVFGVSPRRLPRIPMADTSVGEMATSYLREVRRRQPHGPYHLGGLCAGGVIAFEMAVQLEQAGEQVELVAIFDAVEPLTRPRSFVASERRWRRLQSVFTRPGEKARLIPALELFKATREAMRKALNATEYELSSRLRAASANARFRLLVELMARGRSWPSRVPSLTVRQIYLAAKADYAPEVLRAGRVVVIKATEGADADEPAIRHIEDPLLGWGRVVAGALEAIDIPGGHSSMLQAPHVDVLAAQLRRYLLEPARPTVRAHATTRPH